MIVVYTLDGCPFCDKLKEGLTKNKIKFITKDIENPKYGAEFDKICEFSNTETVPVMLIEKQVFVPDVSFKTIDEAVDLAKRFNQP
jgi:glutaredoxin